MVQLDDGDGREDSQDCAPFDEAVWAVPGEAQSLLLSWNAGTSRVSLTWAAPIELGGFSSTVRYDTIRSPNPGDFGSEAGAVCVESNGTDTSSTDTTTQSPGTVRHYLVRAGNAVCGEGSGGNFSSGAPRSVRACP